MADSSGDDLVSRQKEFIDAFFKKGAELAAELIRDNERLRYRLVEVEAELHAARQKLQGFEQASAAAARYGSRFQEIEHENQNLASLYVAAYQLHATLDPAEVLRTIVEILLNFVGAKTFAIYAIDDDSRRLVPIAAHHVERAALPRPSLDEVGLGQVAASGKPEYHAPPGCIAAVPMRMKDATVGLIAVWELLSHKPALDDVDYELFNLLAAHAAIALEAARLAAAAGEVDARRPGLASLARLLPAEAEAEK